MRDAPHHARLCRPPPVPWPFHPILLHNPRPRVPLHTHAPPPDCSLHPPPPGPPTPTPHTHIHRGLTCFYTLSVCPHTTHHTPHLEPHDALGAVPDLGADDLGVALVLELVVEALPGTLVRVRDRHLRDKQQQQQQAGPQAVRWSRVLVLLRVSSAHQAPPRSSQPCIPSNTGRMLSFSLPPQNLSPPKKTKLQRCHTLSLSGRRFSLSSSSGMPDSNSGSTPSPK